MNHCAPPNALQALAFSLLLAVAACAGAMNASSSVDPGDASADNAYGAGSVIPTFGAEGGSGSSGGYTTFGSDGSPGTPCPREAAAKDSSSSKAAGDASEEGGGDGGAIATCPGGLAAGDLVIDELMIASQSGVGDHGEWLEVMSTRDCTLDLKGLYAEVPHGKGITTASVATDVLVSPHGFFLIADSSDPSVDDDLPGTVIVWGSGTSSDVLKNSGDTITLYTSTVTIDELTYPNPSKLVEGASMAFPSDCDPSLRKAFGNWQPSVASWTPGYFGTPSAPNTDVSCALGPPGPPPPGMPCGR